MDFKLKNMKTHHLIFLTTAIFVALFYEETPGLNLGILGVTISILTFFNTQTRNRTNTFYAVFAASICSSIAFAWYGDFASFLAVFTSLFLLAFKSKNSELKSLFIIPVFAINFLTFIYRIFLFDKWLPTQRSEGFWQKIMAMVIIPGILLLVFFGIYAQGSSHFAALFSGYKLDVNIWEIIVLSILGFFLSFNFWNYAVEKFIYKQNHFLKNDFLQEERKEKPTYSFLDLDSERTSGVISFLMLNVLLVFFIITFNYEQFIELPKTANQLAEETHERVGAVIVSIVMAVLVVMFYFKGSFNFDKKAGMLKVLAKIWVLLNAVMILSAFAKNTEYIINLGLTYKRLGVYAFLILSIIGLMFTFIKIKQQKTNAYIFNQMIWYFYGTVLVCSFINWGNLATYYNITNHKGDFKFLCSLNYNDRILNEKFPLEIKNRINHNKEYNDKASFLSKNLYYETLNLPENK